MRVILRQLARDLSDAEVSLVAGAQTYTDGHGGTYTATPPADADWPDDDGSGGPGGAQMMELDD